MSPTVSGQVVWDLEAPLLLWERKMHRGELRHEERWNDQGAEVSIPVSSGGYWLVVLMKCTDLCVLAVIWFCSCLYFLVVKCYFNKNLFCLSKDKVRLAEGTAVVPDAREPAKLGVSFSYCKYSLLPVLVLLYDFWEQWHYNMLHIWAPHKVEQNNRKAPTWFWYLVCPVKDSITGW